YEYEMHRLIAEDRGDPAPAAPEPEETAPATLAAGPEAEPDPAIPETRAADDGAIRMAAADATPDPSRADALTPSAEASESARAEEAARAVLVARASASDEVHPAEFLAGRVPAEPEPIAEATHRPGEIEQAPARHRQQQPQAAEPGASPGKPSGLPGRGQPSEGEAAPEEPSGPPGE